MGWVTRIPLQDQIQVTKFVPEVLAADGLLVGCAHDVCRQESTEQVQMTGLRLMQSSEQTVNNPEFVGSRDAQVRVAMVSLQLTAPDNGDRFQV